MTITFLVSAFMLGLLGSVHCVGMCGPLALSLPVQHLKGFRKMTGILLYNSGRVFSYFSLGIIFGIVGRSFSLLGYQQIFSIILGSLLLVLFIGYIFNKKIFKSVLIEKKWNPFVIKMMYPLFGRKSLWSVTLIGLLNGLLPCGFIYMAVAGALASGKILDSGLFMAAFGLGTIPAMFLLVIAGSYISMNSRNFLRKFSPYVIAFMGVLLILRGLNLDIPFISPAIGQQAVKACH